MYLSDKAPGVFIRTTVNTHVRAPRLRAWRDRKIVAYRTATHTPYCNAFALHCAALRCSALRHYCACFGCIEVQLSKFRFCILVLSLHRFPPGTQKWCIQQVKGDIPLGRSRCRGVLYRKHFILIGGWNRQVYYDELYVLNCGMSCLRACMRAGVVLCVYVGVCCAAVCVTGPEGSSNSNAPSVHSLFVRYCLVYYNVCVDVCA